LNSQLLRDTLLRRTRIPFPPPRQNNAVIAAANADVIAAATNAAHANTLIYE